MPELPEVQVVKNFFDLQVVGKRISRVNIINNKLRYQIPPRLNSKLSNLIISEILRRGKYLILLFKNSDISLLIHLGMTGYFRLNSFFKPEKHDHIASAGKPNSYWSGIYFHTVNNLSPTVFFNPSSLHKTQQFPKWEESLISSSYWDTWNLYPTDGDVILFPPYLSHFVPPSGNKEKMRFTFSFNLLLTQ